MLSWSIAKNDCSALIERATGRVAYTGEVQEEGEDVGADEDAIEAE